MLGVMRRIERPNLPSFRNRAVAVAGASFAAAAIISASVSVSAEPPNPAAPAPAGTASSSPQQTTLYTVSCVAPGFCTVGGSYTARTKHDLPFVVAESHGRWGHEVVLSLPADAAALDAAVQSIACQTAVNCVAVGVYGADDAGTADSFVATETHGKWSRAVQIAPPADAATPQRVHVEAVSCSSHMDCEAVGNYAPRSGGTEVAMAVTEHHGRWGRAFRIPAPPDWAIGSSSYGFEVS